MCEELTPEDKDYIVYLTKKSEEDVENYYKFFKVRFPNGKIEMKELVEMVKVHFQRWDANCDPDEFSSYAFKASDIDGNGFISFREAAHVMFVHKEDGPKEEKIKFAFRMFDFNQNGKVDKTELIGCMKAIMKSMGQAEGKEEQLEQMAKGVMSEVDTNKDGVMSQEEFVTACKKAEVLFDNMCGFGGTIAQVLKSNLLGKKFKEKVLEGFMDCD